MVMVFLALCVLGLIAWARIPLEMMPGRFQLNRLWVWVPYPGSTPRENETALVHPLEEQVATVTGLKTMESEATANGAEMELSFHRSVGMDAAYNATVDRLERAMSDLPDDVEQYWVYRWSPSDEPVLWAGASLPDTVEDGHYLLTEVVQKRLERVPGVGKVDVWGVDPKAVFVDFSLDALMEHGVSLGEVVGDLAGDNFQLASGRMEDRGRVRYVRSLARYEDLDALRTTPIKPGVTLDDVAAITYRLDPSANVNHIDGRDGAALAINKESDANTVETTERVAEELRLLSLDPRLQGATFHSFFDQGALIRDSVGDLLETALYGGVFAVLVLFAFLRDWRATLLIAGTMPFTMLLTVTVLYFTGGSLNLLSLMGLMLAVGMVVDNAIVVVESIYARRHAGDDPATAAVEGTSEVGLAITMSTLTTVVVFLPIILMSEDADFSFFMGELGLPVIYALCASLLVAVFFTPLTTTWTGRGGRAVLPPEPRWVVRLSQAYQTGLRRVLTHRTDSLVGIVALVLVTVVVPGQAVGCQDDAEGNINDFVVRYEVPRAFTYSERLEVVETYEAWIDAQAERWGVRVHRSRLSATSTVGRTYVYLDDEGEGEAIGRDEVLDEVKDTLPRIAGVDASVGWGGAEGDEKTLSLVLRGESTHTLEDLAVEAKRRVEAVPGVIGVHSNLEAEGGDEMRLQVDREASARFGVGAGQIGRTVGFALRATQLPDFHDGNKEVDVVSRFRLEDRENIDRLLDFPMFSASTMDTVPLRALVQTEVGRGYGTIHRQDRTTAYGLTLDLDKGLDPEGARAGVAAALEGLVLPRGYTWDFGHSFDGDQENDQARNMALLLSVVFVFLIMGVLFESLLLPMSILAAIPLALIGVYWTLYLSGTPLDVMGGVGLVILVGVVVNNGIVLIDVVTRLRHEGLDRAEALVEAGGRRLRPILMTALTTIFGVLPMAVGTSTFIGIPYAPMGRVVAGGMVAGTLLTLFFVPFLYSVLDDVRASGSRWLAWVVAPRATRPQEGK
jgi:hydrophobic/amphiphilic exporter-1 (mainly G- bacteria), HAE1 family